MIDFKFQFEDTTADVKKAVDDASFKNVSHAAASIRKTAVGSIKEAPAVADGLPQIASPPGTPPFTQTGGIAKSGKSKKGRLPRAIAFDVDKEKGSGVIGPRFSVVGLAGEIQEFGEENHPERPFMEPALAGNQDRFAGSFAGSI